MRTFSETLATGRPFKIIWSCLRFMCLCSSVCTCCQSTFDCVVWHHTFQTFSTAQQTGSLKEFPYFSILSFKAGVLHPGRLIEWEHYKTIPKRLPLKTSPTFRTPTSTRIILASAFISRMCFWAVYYWNLCFMFYFYYPDVRLHTLRKLSTKWK